MSPSEAGTSLGIDSCPHIALSNTATIVIFPGQVPVTSVRRSAGSHDTLGWVGA